MIKKLVKKIALLAGSLISTTTFAHIGFHNEIYHPLSSVDHFLIVLIIGLFTGVVTYCFFRK